MANIKITDLTAYTDPAATDVLPIVDVTTDTTKKVAVGEVVGKITGDVDVATDGTSSITAGAIVNDDVNASAAIAGTKIQAATTSNAGTVQLEDSTSSTSTTTAATPNSVKSAYDLADAALPKSGGTMTGPFEQASEAVAAFNVDCSAGNYFTKSISSNSTFTFSNIPANGTAYSFTLEVDVTGSSTAITWPASVEWPYGITAPSLTDTKTHLFMFVTNDGGTTWRGAALVDYTT